MNIGNIAPKIKQYVEQNYQCFEYAIKNGALGGKLIGAGGGGFLLFYTNKPTHLRNAFRKKFEEVKFKFDYEGVKEIF